MSPRTIFLSKLMGLFALSVSSWMLMHQHTITAIAAVLIHDAPLLLLTGLVVLTAGLAIVLAHNVWSGGILPVVVTLGGWLLLIRGLFFLFAPSETLIRIFESLSSETVFYPTLAVTLVVGVYLTYAGFTSSPAPPGGNQERHIE